MRVTPWGGRSIARRWATARRTMMELALVDHPAAREGPEGSLREAGERSRGTLGRLFRILGDVRVVYQVSKSSGVTLSRNSRNFSTSSSSSPGIRIDASDKTSSLA